MTLAAGKRPSSPARAWLLACASVWLTSACAPVPVAPPSAQTTTQTGTQTVSMPSAAAGPRAAAPADEALRQRTQAEVPAMLATLESLAGIESGSRDLEGLTRLAQTVAARLRASGMQVDIKPTKAADFHPTLKGATLGPMVYATRTGHGAKKVLLIAHMDTVYPRGMAAKQPFRIEGDRAYGLGIADDKQGVALILHLVELLAKSGFADYAQLGVLINGDEEIGSPGSREFITQLGTEYDAVFSFEGGGSAAPGGGDMVRLATSSTASVELKVYGKASHAGSAPHLGRNAIYELAHQMLKSRSLGDPAKGLQINWTIASGGEVSNVIPAEARAVGDVRSRTDRDLDLMEAALKKSIEDKLIPDTRIELNFRRGRPAFVANAAAHALARHAAQVYQEIGMQIQIRERATGGGTDAAYAGLRPKGGVLEGFGLRGFGSHSSDNEYILVSNIAPRLYLATRMVMDMGRGRIRW